VKVGRRQIDISNRNKMFFPDAGLTKGDLVDYYLAVAETMLPHLKHYGVNMQRFPDGIDGKSFYQKDASDYFPDWIDTVTIPKREGGSFAAPVISSKAALAYLVDQAMLTPHLYLSRKDDLEHPDRMIFDLDPPGGQDDAKAVRSAALDLYRILEELDLQSWAQTTGSKGFHIIVPLDRSAGFDTVRGFAEDTVRLLVRRHPERYTLAQQKDQRAGKIFLDWLRNAYGATAVAPYAVRALPAAPVATPLEWQELENGAGPRDWTIENIPDRLGQKNDPMAGIMRHARSLAPRREKLDQLLARESPAEEEKE